jgi:predicted ATPase/class 3 adenylate cyclase
MAELPTGTVTFLFTDLEGSTRLWEEHPQAMRAALARHDEILRGAVEAQGGVVVKSTGDGLHAAFASAESALLVAAAGQVGLAAERFEATGALRVRMGIHTGAGDSRDGDYFGPALNRAARLMAVAHGGQVLVSLATEELVRDSLPAELGLMELGEHRLRDLSRPERVFQLQGPGLRVDFPALASLDALPGNLPLQVSSFIGRERELARVARVLGEARVLTLTGVGGVGKTRLALQVAAEVLPRFREGAWLVELAPVRDLDEVVGAVAAVFGVTARSGQSLTASLVEFLGTKQLLLLLDNCEHVLEAVADLVDLVERSCAGVVVLATSREGLALDGERVMPVPSLAGPPADADLDATGRAEAVHLFVERARDVDPDFSLTAANAGAVAQVCRRLDGMPLAIELAAARVRTMNPTELLRGLDRRFETLAGGRRRAVQRHQTLRAAIDWSYELCSEPERRLLARLAVFAGGCTREAAEVVCAGPPIETRRVFELLSALVDRSLVIAERDQPQTRYRLLETIREYGEERLAELDETDTLRDRHAEHYADFAGVNSERLRGPDQLEALRRLAAELENLLAAMNHAIDSQNVDLALRLLCNTPGPGFQVGFGLFLPAGPALTLAGASDHPLYARAVAVAAIQAASRGDADESRSRCEQALGAASHRPGDPDPSVDFFVSQARAISAFSRGAWADAATHFVCSAEVARSTGESSQLAMSLGAAAWARTMDDDAAGAVPLATEGLAAARRFGMPSATVINLNALASALTDQDPQRAQALLSESRQLASGLGYEIPNELTNTLLTAARLGDWTQVLELASASIRYLHWNNDAPQLAGVLNVVARALAPTDGQSAAMLQGAARRLATAAIPSLDRTASAPGPARASADQSTRAPAGGVGFITQLRRTTTGLLLHSLGEARLRELRVEGEDMDHDHAVAYALTSIERGSRGMNG